MNIQQLFDDYSISYDTEGKNLSQGWIGLTCPYCNDVSNHLGFDLQRERFHCWRCGSKPLVKTIADLLNVEHDQAHKIIYDYGGFGGRRPRLQQPKVEIRLKAHRLPSNTSAMEGRHRRYLQGRNFDAEKLEREWRLLGTGPISNLDGVDYRHRIVVPIFWHDRQVSFQTRDITGKHRLRYISCPKVRELKHHKHVLYGRQDSWNETGIIVEGVTDVWRLGFNAAATFGIEFTPMQVRQIARHFKRVVVLYDNEPQANKQAERLIGQLKFKGVQAHRMVIKEGDPASMKQDDADHLVRKIMKWKG